MLRALLFPTALLLGAAGGGFAADPTPQELADRLTGDAAGPASVNPQCALFSPEEVAGFLGRPVAAGENAGMGMGCQWLARDDDGDAMITVVPAEYAERPSLAPGFRAVPEIGPDAFVVPELGGWAAGTVTGESFVKVSLAGPAASEAAALALLQQTLSRRAR